MLVGYMRVSSDCDSQTTDPGLEIVLLCPTSPRLAQVFPNPGFKTPDRRVMSIAEGDQLANMPLTMSLSKRFLAIQ